MTSPADAVRHLLFEGLEAGQAASLAAVPPHRRVLTPAESRAAETTRVAREFTDTEAEKRQAQVARLRKARLAREEAEPAAPKGRKKG